MATQKFLSDDFSHPHHRRTVTVLILAVLVFGLLIVGYLYSTDNTRQEGNMPLGGSSDRTTLQSQTVSQLSQGAPTSVSDADKRKVIQRMTRPSSGLSNAQKLEIISQLQAP